MDVLIKSFRKTRKPVLVVQNRFLPRFGFVPHAVSPCPRRIFTAYLTCTCKVAEDGEPAIYCDECTLRSQLTAVHEEGHPSLVRWLKSKRDENTKALLSVSHRLDSLEKMFSDQAAALQEREETINERFTALESKIDERFNRVEELLQLIIVNGQ